ncbi:MAG: cytochrome c peroxidase [Bacteroidota bacterium]
MKTNVYLLIPFLTLLFLVSCVDDAVKFEEFNYRPEDYQVLIQSLDLPEEPFEYTVELPNYMTRTGLVARTVSDNRATLGRVLFYDKNLSANGTVSCASCHKQELAFSDNKAFSQGFKGEDTDRNSIALGSVVSFAAYYGGTSRAGLPFFWDERAASASEQSQASLTSAVEMGMTHDELISRVSSKDYYKILFEAAFRDPEITEQRILLAIESFVDGIGSYESKLDEALDANQDLRIEEDLPQLTAAENRGKSLFVQNCGNCHGRELARPGMPSANNGLDMVYSDKGVGAVYGAANLNGVFKVPALRNVAVTSPYMHDGRFASLDEVLDFYSGNIQNHKNLSGFLKESTTNTAKKFNFSNQDKQDIIAFLNTLTDYKMMSYEKYSNPFK